VRFVDADFEVFILEVIVPDPQAVAWLTGIDSICAVREGVAHVLDGPGRAQQFGFSGA